MTINPVHAAVMHNGRMSRLVEDRALGIPLEQRTRHVRRQIQRSALAVAAAILLPTLANAAGSTQSWGLLDLLIQPSRAAASERGKDTLPAPEGRAVVRQPEAPESKELPDILELLRAEQNTDHPVSAATLMAEAGSGSQPALPTTASPMEEARPDLLEMMEGSPVVPTKPQPTSEAAATTTAPNLFDVLGPGNTPAPATTTGTHELGPTLGIGETRIPVTDAATTEHPTTQPVEQSAIPTPPKTEEPLAHQPVPTSPHTVPSAHTKTLPAASPAPKPVAMPAMSPYPDDPALELSAPSSPVAPARTRMTRDQTAPKIPKVAPPQSPMDLTMPAVGAPLDTPGVAKMLNIEPINAMQRLQMSARSPTQGAKQQLANRPVESLSLDDVANLALGQNLTLHQTQKGIEENQQVLFGKSAPFSLNLNFSLSHTAIHTYERTETFLRLRDAPDLGTIDDLKKKQESGTELTSEEQALLDYYDVCIEMGLSSVGTTTIDGVPVDTGEALQQCRELSYLAQKEYASSAGLGWDQSVTGSLGLSKLFDWGGSASANLSATHYIYDLPKTGPQGETLLKPTEGNLFDRVVLYHLEDEWTSQFSYGMNLALPYTKNFGRTASSLALDEDLAALNVEMAQWAHQSTVNMVLEEALSGYWELVRLLLRVEGIIGQQRLAQKQLDRTQRLFDMSQSTEYDLLQAKTQTTVLHHKEEQAWNDYVVQANNLADLLQLDGDALPVPANYREQLTLLSEEDEAEILQRARTNRPELKMQRLNVDGTQRTLAQKQHQLRPDLSMNLSHSLSQSNAVVGYGSLLESLGNIVDPDSSNLYVGLTFTYPLGNTAAKSALAQARAVRDQALDQYRSTEVQISQEINNALATEKSGRLQVKLSEANLKQAHLAYEHAVQLYEIGRDSASTEEEDVAGGGARINDFTLLQRQQELFNAQLGYIDAIAAYQKARVRLLAAEGGLDKTYQALLPAMEVYAPAPVITMDQTP